MGHWDGPFHPALPFGVRHWLIQAPAEPGLALPLGPGASCLISRQTTRVLDSCLSRDLGLLDLVLIRRIEEEPESTAIGALQRPFAVQWRSCRDMR